MPFEEPKFERPSGGDFEEEEEPTKDIEKEEEEKIGREKLKSFVEGISERLKAERVPVKENCRIDMEAFQDVYSQETIDKDRKLVERYEKKWHKGLSLEEIEEKKLETTGEKLEMLKTSIFDKFLGKDFIITRTSSFDDIVNKIDNVILEKETGNLICAFDEVGENSGRRYEEKKSKILERNIKENGGKLKYGLRLEKDKEDQTRLVKDEIKDIPILYLALPKRIIKEGIRNLIPSLEKQSKYEKKLFDYFIASFDSQIQSLKLEPRLSLAPKERLYRFEEILQKFKKGE